MKRKTLPPVGPVTPKNGSLEWWKEKAEVAESEVGHLNLALAADSATINQLRDELAGESGLKDRALLELEATRNAAVAETERLKDGNYRLEQQNIQLAADLSQLQEDYEAVELDLESLENTVANVVARTENLCEDVGSESDIYHVFGVRRNTVREWTEELSTIIYLLDDSGEDDDQDYEEEVIERLRDDAEESDEIPELAA